VRFEQQTIGDTGVRSVMALLLAFVCLASAALFISAGGSVGGIWTQANTRLAAANTAAAS